jgi:hypothetical protein
LPLPLAAHDAPLEATHVQVGNRSVAGMVSATVAPTAVDGPLFVATMVYDTVAPGVSDDWPLVFVIDKSARGPRVSVSVAELLPGVGSVIVPGTATVAVFARLPVTDGFTVPVRVNVTVAPTARFTD